MGEVKQKPDTILRRNQGIEKNYSLLSHRVASDVIISSGTFAAATILDIIFEKMGFHQSNLIMMYMLGVLICSISTYYRITNILYVMVGILTFNYFFTEPKRTFHVDNTTYLVTFLVMFITAVTISTLTRKVKNNANISAKKTYRTEILLETSQKLQQARTAAEIGERTVKQLGELLSCNIYCFLGEPSKCSKPIVYLEEKENSNIFSEEELAVAQWTYQNNHHAGATTGTLSEAHCLYFAIRSGKQVFAVVAIEVHNKIAAFEESILHAILNESALAFEKDDLMRKQQEVAVKLEQEQLRANLLRSISHDLRTPLTSISGNAGMLMERQNQITEEQKQKIYSDIYDDSMWLINLVENLLSVTRIENGSMKLNIQTELMDDVITESLRHINRRATEHQITVDQEDEMLLSKMDAKLMIQVIMNLVDNAIKYTQPGSKITIKVKQVEDQIHVEVSDDGAGISEEEKKKIFLMFYTSNQTIPDGRRGMGLGLPLCKAIIEAHGGTIWVSDHKPRGTTFGFALKAEEAML